MIKLQMKDKDRQIDNDIGKWEKTRVWVIDEDWLCLRCYVPIEPIISLQPSLGEMLSQCKPLIWCIMFCVEFSLQSHEASVKNYKHFTNTQRSFPLLHHTLKYTYAWLSDMNCKYGAAAFLIFLKHWFIPFTDFTAFKWCIAYFKSQQLVTLPPRKD